MKCCPEAAMLIRRSCFAFSLVVAGSIPTGVRAQTVAVPLAAQFELKGIVVDVARAPIAGAEVAALDRGNTLGQVLTATDGTFTLVALPAGPVSLRMRRLGYEPKTIELQIGLPGPAPLDIVLTATATELKRVVIKVEEVSELDEFNQHRKQNRGTAKFYDQEEIRKRGAMYASDLFRTVPGVRVQSNMGAGGNAIRIRGCQPIVWIDGQRVPGVELDEVTTPGDIAGIEFYPSMAGTPAKYSERSARPCGTLLVWTKSR
jgi:hypothetical protein